MDPTTYPLSNFAVCIGQAAYGAQLNNYERDLKVRDLKWAGDRNVWSMKLSKYDTDIAEASNTHSRLVSAIQRDFGLETDKFHFQNEKLYQQLISSLPVNEGGRARGFGRKQRLTYGYSQAGLSANLRRKGVWQTEALKKAGRTKLNMQNKARSDLGVAPVPGVAPAKPVAPSALEFGLTTASTVMGIASGVQGIGSAAGWAQGGTGFWSNFFSP